MSPINSGTNVYGEPQGSWLWLPGDRDAAIERMRQITSAWADSDYWASAISAEDASELLDAAGGERT